MEKKPVYRQLPGCKVSVCTGEVAVDERGYCRRHYYLATEPIRKPVFCAHPDIEDQMRMQQVVTCHICHERWDTGRYGNTPKVIIGYVEAGEDGGSK